MLINEVCKRCGLTKKAIEYYEEQGLTRPQIMENGYRVFSEDDVIQLNKSSFDKLVRLGELLLSEINARRYPIKHIYNFKLIIVFVKLNFYSR